jgi:tetratricopeptide (TPR) repeat protein
MEGRGAESIRAARKTAAALTKEDVHGMPMLQWLKGVPVCALARFGKWDEILREPPPAEDALYETAMWHYGRGLAHVRKRQPDEAGREAAALKKIAEGKAIQALEMESFPGASLVRIARTVLDAELAGLRGDTEELIRQMEAAVRLQDSLPYMEPPYWYYPIRQSLGAALLQAGQLTRAEAVYREDLKRHPRNGWSLFGLLQCLRAQGQTGEAVEIEKQFREAWKDADVALTASRL